MSTDTAQHSTTDAPAAPVKLTPEQKAAAKVAKAALKAQREAAEKSAREAAEARRSTLHDAAIPLLVTAAKVDDDASVKSSPLYSLVAPRIVDLRESYIPFGGVAGWEATSKATGNPQYRTLIVQWYREAAELTVAIPAAPENPGAEATDEQKADFEAAFAAYSTEVEPLRIRQNHLKSILPNRVQYHVERELERRYGVKPKSATVAPTNPGDTGRTAAGSTSTEASQDFLRMSVGQAPKGTVDPVEHARKLTGAALALTKVIESKIGSGVAGRETLIQYVNQTINVLVGLSDTLIGSAPESEQDELRARADASRRVSVAMVEAQLRALLDAPAPESNPAAPVAPVAPVAPEHDDEPTDEQLDSVENDENENENEQDDAPTDAPVAPAVA